MVAAVLEMINPKVQGLAEQPNSKMPPLLPFDPDNALNPCRPKSREVSSRYLATSSSTSSSSLSVSSTSSMKRPSPVVSRNDHSTAMVTAMRVVPSAIKQSQSTERRRLVTPRSNSLDLRTISKSNGELTEA